MRRRPDSPVDFYDFELSASGGALLAGCTGRAGGVSSAPYEQLNLGFHVGDDPASVRENRLRVATSVGADLGSFVVAEQVHEGTVATVTSADAGRGASDAASAIAATDALITQVPGLVLAVLVADCVPVIVSDPETPAIGVAHAGWRGTVSHIARNTVQAMAGSFGSDPAQMRAAIGPSIGPQSYEVGEDVAARARSEFPEGQAVSEDGEGRLFFDLWASNRADLLGAGLPAERIEVAEVDTYSSEELFFSHRRRQPSGRFMALAALR